MTSDYKFSSVIGVIGMMIGLVSFLVHYHFVTYSLPGYQLLVAPAMFSLSFFSEETSFISKMVIFSAGQFIGYFLVAFILCKIVRGFTAKQ